jgi:predicted RNase H-related nuclease YkuK (DUF458 family)
MQIGVRPTENTILEPAFSMTTKNSPVHTWIINSTKGHIYKDTFLQLYIDKHGYQDCSKVQYSIHRYHRALCGAVFKEHNVDLVNPMNIKELNSRICPECRKALTVLVGDTEAKKMMSRFRGKKPKQVTKPKPKNTEIPWYDL